MNVQDRSASEVNAPVPPGGFTSKRQGFGARLGVMATADSTIRVVPANEASWEDLQAILGTRGGGARCQCQRYKLARGESFGRVPVEVRAARLREQTDCGNPESGTTSGLVAYAGDEPAGWAAVEPRTAYDGLVRNHNRAAWVGRTEDRTDESVWAVTCLFTRAGYRRRGVSRALAAASVGFARARGARVLEAYPINTTEVILEELHVGTVDTFLAAGFTEVHRPSLRRVVVRIEL